ncbi:DUF4339 domain-containing protein [Akkermansia muciniphila]|uniref:DUF4339 domain-containing protein n=1 Tax=Akkermansia muciniphila TaxID=239935 RepID=UPI000C9984AC|nr:DUF4339 domain-containing protein [Akkermansia muciniphila]PNC89894.1 hypothetical protein CXT91_10115 [Akkermansia muciniphila]
MANYYVASNSNNAEGPYSFEELEALYKEGKILSETLVCPEGGQEWLSFGRIYHLTKNTNRKSEEKETERQQKKSFVEVLLDKSEKRREEMLLEKKQELNKQEPLKITVEGLFQVVGAMTIIAGIVLFLSHFYHHQFPIAFIYLLSGAFSCLGCFWFAKVLTLLQKIADKK